MSEPRLYGPDDRFHPFSNGTEYEMWLSSNCCRGEKGCRHYRPNATSSRDGCPIEVAVALAGGTDGMISMRHALCGGFVRPGPRGLYEDATWGIASDGLPCSVIVACPEFRGYDEPDDRPRRGPQPPADQLDLLDPRHSPGRPAVSA
jgi:hypothetical protein